MIRMINKCKTCKYHENSNEKMKARGNKVIAGNFCLKFHWNLDRVQTWVEKKEITTGKFKPMTKIPGDCYER